MSNGGISMFIELAGDVLETVAAVVGLSRYHFF
jgi:hypothetical protein